MGKGFAARMKALCGGRVGVGKPWSGRGFSLVELLVTVVIIMVVAAISVPLFLNQKQKAYRTVAANEGAAWAAEVSHIVSKYTALGSSEMTGGGTIALTSAGVLTVTMPSGHTPPSEPGTVTTNVKVSANTTMLPFTSTSPTADGYLGYGRLKEWCFIADHRGQRAVFTQAGEVAGATTCPDPLTKPQPGDNSGTPDAPTLALAQLGTVANPYAGFIATWTPAAVGAGQSYKQATMWTVKYKLTTASNDAWIVAGEYPAGTLTATVNGLTYGASYQVQVSGSNTSGQGGWTQQTITPTVFSPTPPTTAIDVRCNTVAFTYTPYVGVFPPTDGALFNGGAPITTVQLYYSTNGGASWVSAHNGAPQTTLEINNARNATTGATTFVAGTTYQYRTRVSNNNGASWSGYTTGTFTINDPSFPLPAPDTYDDTYVATQLATWRTGDPVSNEPGPGSTATPATTVTTPVYKTTADAKNFVFTLPALPYPCTNTPIAGYEAQAYADGVPFPSEGSYINVAANTTTRWTAQDAGWSDMGDTQFTFKLRAIPSNLTTLQPSAWSEVSAPILTVPSRPHAAPIAVTSGPRTYPAVTWAWKDQQNNETQAWFIKPDRARPDTFFKVAFDSYVPRSNTAMTRYAAAPTTATAASRLGLSNALDLTPATTGPCSDAGTNSCNDAGRIQSANGASTTTTASPLTQIGEKYIETKGNVRGNTLPAWNQYSDEDLQQCQSVPSAVRNANQVRCVNATLNGTTDYYYSVKAKNATGEGWASNEFPDAQISNTTLVGARSLAAKPLKPKLAPNNGSGFFLAPWGKVFTVWEFDTSDLSQRKFISGTGTTPDNRYRFQWNSSPTTDAPATLYDAQNGQNWSSWEGVYVPTSGAIYAATNADGSPRGFEWSPLSSSWRGGTPCVRVSAAAADYKVTNLMYSVAPNTYTVTQATLPNWDRLAGAADSNSTCTTAMLAAGNVHPGYKVEGWTVEMPLKTQYINPSWVVRACTRATTTFSSGRYTVGAGLTCSLSEPTQPAFTSPEWPDTNTSGVTSWTRFTPDYKGYESIEAPPQLNGEYSLVWNPVGWAGPGAREAAGTPGAYISGCGAADVAGYQRCTQPNGWNNPANTAGTPTLNGLFKNRNGTNTGRVKLDMWYSGSGLPFASQTSANALGLGQVWENGKYYGRCDYSRPTGPGACSLQYNVPVSSPADKQETYTNVVGDNFTFTQPKYDVPSTRNQPNINGVAAWNVEAKQSVTGTVTEGCTSLSLGACRLFTPTMYDGMSYGQPPIPPNYFDGTNNVLLPAPQRRGPVSANVYPGTTTPTSELYLAVANQYNSPGYNMLGIRLNSAIYNWWGGWINRAYQAPNSTIPILNNTGWFYDAGTLSNRMGWGEVLTLNASYNMLHSYPATEPGAPYHQCMPGLATVTEAEFVANPNKSSTVVTYDFWSAVQGQGGVASWCQ